MLYEVITKYFTSEFHREAQSYTEFDKFKQQSFVRIYGYNHKNNLIAYKNTFISIKNIKIVVCLCLYVNININSSDYLLNKKSHNYTLRLSRNNFV